MVLVAQEQLQRVLAGLELNFRLALAATEMKVVEVVGYRLVERWQLGIDQEMMMAGIFPIGARRREAHVLQSEIHGEFRRQHRSILHRIREIYLSARR